MNPCRRLVLCAIALSAVAPRVEGARPKRVVLFIGSTTQFAEQARRQIIDHLGAEGFVAGRDVEVELVVAERWSEVAKAADRIVASRPDVIATGGTDLTKLIQERTRDIPVVFRNVADPVGAGLVQSLPRPGGNITGESNQSYALEGKRYEILRELRPRLRRVLVVSVGGIASDLAGKEQRVQAQRLGITLDELIVARDRVEAEFARILPRIVATRPDAVVFQAFDPRLAQEQRLLKELEARAIPAMFLDNRVVQAGGLISLGIRNDVIDPTPVRIMARVLRGESPATIPVAQMTRTHLALNLRTARAMKLEVPESVRLRADEVID